MHKLIDLVLDKIFEHGALPVGWEEYLKQEDTIDLIAEKADILLYPTKELMGEINGVAKNIATTIALMSFFPDGVTFWGALYRSSFDAESQ
jgi:hypothetical protein